MLNRIMQIQFGQIETPGPVRTIEEICSELGHEEAEGGGKVECVPDFGAELSKGDVLPVVREDAVVRHGVEHGAGRSGIAFFRGDVFGPDEAVSCCVWGNDMAGFEGGSKDIEDEEGKVPGEDENIDEEAGDFVEDTHIHLVELGRGVMAVDEAI
jgi:hypothetical protein